MDINQYIKDELIMGTDKSVIIGEVAQRRNCSRDSARKIVARIRKQLEAQNQLLATPAAPTPQNVMAQQNIQPGTVVPVSCQLTPNGDKIFEDIVACMNGKDVNPIDIMRAHHLNPAEWEVVALKSNLWQGMAKGGTQVPMYQSKLSLRPRNGGTLKIEDVKEYFDNMQKSGYKFPQIPVPKVVPTGDNDGVILELDIADIHIGLLAWAKETGRDFDMKIVTKLFKNANMDLYNQVKTSNVKVKEIKIVTLGDVLHVDNDNQTTTKGTFQQVDGRLPKIFDEAVDLMIWCVAFWEEVAPVEYIYIRGNHDQVLGYAVARSISIAFRNHPNVKCDIEPNPHKYRKLVWDKKSKKERPVMVVFSHGDMNKANLEALPYTLANHDMNGVAKRYIHVGHLHNQNSYTTRDGGTEVVHIDSFCYGSYWEHQQGYGETDDLFLNMFMWRRNSTRPCVLIGDSSIAYK